MVKKSDHKALSKRTDGSDAERRISSLFSGKKNRFFANSYSTTSQKIISSDGDENEQTPIINSTEEGGEEVVAAKNCDDKSLSERTSGSDSERKMVSSDDDENEKSTKLDKPKENPTIDSKEEGGEEVVAAGEGNGPHQMVKKTIRLFNKYYLQQVQEEQQRCKKQEEDAGAKRPSKRPDLKAITKMVQTGATLHCAKRFGNVPGIDVGHQFYSRAEMVVVGIHGHWLKGIDYMTAATYGKKKEFKSYDFPLAVSIVVSGQYEDDLDNSDDIVYTGQGGNDLLGNKRQIKDQVMLRGNLALKKNMEQKVSVRVIRGHKCASSYTGKVYSYDGLYRVVSHWDEKGVAGFNVFKYRLRRIEGQPTLTTTQVYFTRAHAPRCVTELPGKVCDDISGGKENIPVPASNLVDDPPFAPTGYTYCNSVKLAEGLTPPTIHTGCNCEGGCIDPNICACAKLNGSEFPYVGLDGGRLIEAKAVVFECGPNCKCGPRCVNRTSQHGLRYRLEVYRTSNKGWAVRSWDFIPSGAPVCEYTGKLTRVSDLDDVAGNEFIFEIDCLQTMKGLDGRQSRVGAVSLPATSSNLKQGDDRKMENAPEFCIDAGTTGCVARFFNHSCEPNMFVQCVLSSHHDLRLARIVLFAADNIPPLQELTYDYGYALDSVIGADGEIKILPCHCGAKDCSKRLY